MSKGTEFAVFKAEFLKRQKQFGMTGVRADFHTAPQPDSYATISTNIGGGTTCVTFASDTTADQRKHQSTKNTAKHEAIHLMCHRAQNLAESRYTSQAEITEAFEELVVKLMGLIP